MKYAVDKIEDDIIVLENIKTNEIKKIKINEINFNVKESDILIYKNNKYIKDDNEKESRLKTIQEKFNRVKNI